MLRYLNGNKSFQIKYFMNQFECKSPSQLMISWIYIWVRDEEVNYLSCLVCYGLLWHFWALSVFRSCLVYVSWPCLFCLQVRSAVLSHFHTVQQVTRLEGEFDCSIWGSLKNDQIRNSISQEAQGIEHDHESLRMCFLVSSTITAWPNHYQP